MLAVLPALAVRIEARGRGWTDGQRWTLATGALVPFILLAALQEADNPNRPDDTTGMTLVGVAFLILLLGLGVRLRRRVRADRPWLIPQ